MSPLIKKSSGEFEDFDASKLRRSLKMAGASTSQTQKILNEIVPSIREGTSTKKIFNLAFRLLRKHSQFCARNYSLKKAIFDLGPGGFLFEIFVAEVIKAKGFKVKIGLIKKGCCVKHEIDVLGSRNDKNIFVECKFHNHPSRKNDIKTALYIHSRFLDLKNNPNNDFDEFWLVSNTSFSSDAIKYAECVGLKLVGINCPEEDMQTIVNRYQLHPITSLTHLKARYKKELLEKNIVIAKSLLKKRKLLLDLGMEEEEIAVVFKEIKDMKKI